MTLPATTRTPGNYHFFDLVSAAQGLTPLQARILLIGQMLATGTATADTPTRPTSDADADAMFGVGSEAALMYRAAAETARLKGLSPEIWVSGIADAGGTTAEWTITVTAGTVAVADAIVVRIAGRRINVNVSVGDDEDAVAAAINTAIGTYVATKKNLPVTSAVVDNVATLSSVNDSANANSTVVEVESVGLTGLTIVAAVSVAGVGVADPETALDVSLATYFEAVAIANFLAADVTLLVAHLAEAWASDAKRWRFCFVGATVSLATAVARAGEANLESVVVVSCEDSPSLPSEIAAAQSCAMALRALPNYNWDNDELPLYPPPPASVYSGGPAGELETALAGGVTPLVPNDAGTRLRTVRLVTTLTTVASQPFENAKDVATIRGMIYVTRDLDAVFSQKFGAVNKSARVLKQMRSVAYARLKLWEAAPLEVVQNVDEHFHDLTVESDPNVATRALINVPEAIVPNLHQREFTHTLIVE